MAIFGSIQGGVPGGGGGRFSIYRKTHPPYVEGVFAAAPLAALQYYFAVLSQEIPLRYNVPWRDIGGRWRSKCTQTSACFGDVPVGIRGPGTPLYIPDGVPKMTQNRGPGGSPGGQVRSRGGVPQVQAMWHEACRQTPEAHLRIQDRTHPLVPNQAGRPPRCETPSATKGARQVGLRRLAAGLMPHGHP